MKCTRAVWLVSILGIIFLGAAAPRAQATNLSQIKQIAAGEYHTCALLANGTVRCWGWNGYGQLGNGNTTDSHAPVGVSGLTGAVAIAAGGNHTCALLSDGKVWCWGRNNYGQLGDGSTTKHTTPVKVTGLDRVVAITAGSDHTCAVLAIDGKVKCWGRNDRGQLGDKTRIDRLVPGLVKSSGGGDLTGVIAIAAGGGVNASNVHSGHTCALLADGRVLCWGRNNYGQLGNPSPGSFSTTPVQAKYPDSTPLHNIVAIAAGGFHSCALRWDGQVLCWGDNNEGQVGDGTSGNNRQKAQKVKGLSNAIAIAAGKYHSCAVVSGGIAECWGYGQLGQLGDGSGTNRKQATEVTGLNGAVAIAAGGYHSCAVLSSLTAPDGTVTGGAARCWGYNNHGQLGNGQYYPSAEDQPVTVIAASSLVGRGATGVSAGNYHSCALLGDGTVKCWGDSSYGQVGYSTSYPYINSTPEAVTGLSNVVAISAGKYHTCGLLVNGTVWCWGVKLNGSINDVPKVISSLSNAVAIAAGGAGESGAYSYTCALLAGGTVKCWGDNQNGQLGNGSTVDSSTPVQVTNPDTSRLTKVVAISAGGAHTCALLADGTVRCWGQNNYGQVGDGTTSNRLRAQKVKGLSNAIAIAAGSRHACAVVTTGKVWCWGLNNHGQLGDGTDKAYSSTPVEVANVSDAVGIAAGGDTTYDYGHTCALLANGTAKCWGLNNYGQLGDGSKTQRKTPVDVRGLTGAVAITAGGYHTCAVLSDGTAKCWGRNNRGQLGNGTTNGALTPVSTKPLSP